jgi:hypothetical protein
MKTLFLVLVVAAFTMINCKDEKKEVDATMDARTDSVADIVSTDHISADVSKTVKPDIASQDLSRD